VLYYLLTAEDNAKTAGFFVRPPRQGDIRAMEELLVWSNQVLRYFDLKRLSIGLNEEEQRLFRGLQEAVDRATRY
jgi:hypothetical protein